MLVFVTGASGYIGTVLCKQLVEHGHQVLGLARSEKSANALVGLGYQVLRGDLHDLDSLKQGAKAADGVIHLAYDNESAFKDYAAAGELDMKAVEAIASVLEGTNKSFVTTSGTLAVSGRHPFALETDDGLLDGMAKIRLAPEHFVLSLKDKGIRSAAVRLPPSVHSDSDKGFILLLIDKARTLGFSAYVGEGTNVWPTTHVTDAAAVYRLALDKAPPGARFHAAAESGVAFKDIAGVIGSKLGIPVKGISQQEAVKDLGFLGMVVGMDNPTSSEITRKTLGWEPTGPTLIDDLKAGHYFERVADKYAGI